MRNINIRTYRINSRRGEKTDLIKATGTNTKDTVSTGFHLLPQSGNILLV